MIKDKIIHLLGGYTYKDLDNERIRYYNMGSLDEQYKLYTYFNKLEKDNYGISKQQWIDIMHNAISNLKYNLYCLSYEKN